MIPESTITINKKAVGGDGEFGYTTEGGGGLPETFKIKTTGGTGEQSNPGIVPGSYTVTESSLPSGWNFTSLECTTTGGAGGFALTGTVSFRFYSTPSECEGTSTEQTGIAVESASETHGPLSAGSYSFQAKYVAGLRHQPL